MRHFLIVAVSTATFLTACGKDPAPVIQPGVPVGQGQVVVQPQQPQEYQQAPQPQVTYQQPAVVAAPQPTVIVQQPQVDHSGAALVTGMALGALMNSGNNTTVYRDRYVPAPAPAYPTYERRDARATATATTNVIVQAPAQPATPTRANLGTATLPAVRPGVAAPAALPTMKPAPAPVAKAAPAPVAKAAPAPAKSATLPTSKPSTSTSKK